MVEGDKKPAKSAKKKVATSRLKAKSLAAAKSRQFAPIVVPLKHAPARGPWRTHATFLPVAAAPTFYAPRPIPYATVPVWPPVSHPAPPTFVVDAPPGSLGIKLENGQAFPYVEVTGISKTSPLVDKLSIGDRIISVDHEILWQKDVSLVVGILIRKISHVRRLEMMRVVSQSGPAQSKEYERQLQAAEAARKAMATQVGDSTPVAKDDTESKAIEALTGMASAPKDGADSAVAASAAPDQSDGPEETPIQSASEVRDKSSDERNKPDSTSAMAVETPLESADADVERFMDC